MIFPDKKAVLDTDAVSEIKTDANKILTLIQDIAAERAVSDELAAKAVELAMYYRFEEPRNKKIESISNMIGIKG